VASLKLPRHQIQKNIRAGLVTVNGKLPSMHRWLKIGDIIEVNYRAASAAPPLPNLIVVDETDEYLVINKPSGVLVHPAAGSTAPVLTAALVRQYPVLASVGAQERPRIVHRLDRDVSGLMFVAKTQNMYNHLTQQFRTHCILKQYTALVEGKLTKPEGVWRFPLARSKTHSGRMVARPLHQPGREAETRYQVKKSFEHHTLLEIELITGRTHQIRAHCKASGHAIVGDILYNTRRRQSPGTHTALNILHRPFLQATTLGFFDQSNHWHEYTAALDKELQNFLTTIPR
jgi:23S rRNA pseudouridine1911/1915/1917 synthase